MKKETKMLLIVAALAVAAYIAIRMYENKQATTQGSGGSATVPVGSNLNSIAPELIGGSTGPSIGPALSTPITITVNNPSPPPQGSANPVGNMMANQNVVRSPLGWANPNNAMTGSQASAPVASDVSGGSAAASSAATGTTATTPASAGGTAPTTNGRTPAGPAATRTPPHHRPRRARPLVRPGAPQS